MSKKIVPSIEYFIQNHPIPTPYLFIELDKIKNKYRELTSLFTNIKLFYAIKANPELEVLKTLNQLGSHFDAASLEEIELALATGCTPSKICCGNTIKKPEDIEKAYQLGIRTFTLDAEMELEKIARLAPGAQIIYRLTCLKQNALWPLKNKFGASIEETKKLLLKSLDLNVKPYGISFHVGSQQLCPDAWRRQIAKVSKLFSWYQNLGGQLQCINLGGGLPANYQNSVFDLHKYAQVINQALKQYFPHKMPKIMLEPGRSMVAEAGTIVTKVLLTTDRVIRKKSSYWVYIDIGKYSGLMDAADDKVIYPIESLDKGPLVPCYLAGPTCDSTDIIYSPKHLSLPNNLKPGQLLKIEHAGAYTISFASVGFNGFKPPTVYFI